MVGHEAILATKAHAGEVLPLVAELGVECAWAGIIPMSLDGAPVVGRIAMGEEAEAAGAVKAGPLYIISGMGGSGMLRSPFAAQLLAEQIHTGQPPPPAFRALLDPMRLVRRVPTN